MPVSYVDATQLLDAFYWTSARGIHGGYGVEDSHSVGLIKGEAAAPAAASIYQLPVNFRELGKNDVLCEARGIFAAFGN